MSTAASCAKAARQQPLSQGIPAKTQAQCMRAAQSIHYGFNDFLHQFSCPCGSNLPQHVHDLQQHCVMAKPGTSKHVDDGVNDLLHQCVWRYV
eukprot:5957840-Amphidinium_carterae.1